jgi:hypothetical protein
MRRNTILLFTTLLVISLLPGFAQPRMLIIATAGSVVDARGQRPFLVVAPVQTDKTKEAMIEVAKEIRGVAGERARNVRAVDEAALPPRQAGSSGPTRSSGSCWETCGRSKRACGSSILTTSCGSARAVSRWSEVPQPSRQSVDAAASCGSTA